MTVYGRALEGAVSGWASSTENNLHIRNAPLRTGAATLLVNAASLMGKVPAALKPELRYQTFRRYCALNAGLEASAELAYRRLLEITSNADQRETFGRIREDEGRHAAAFRILAAAVTDDDRLAAGASLDGLLTSLGAISPWFVPASLRSGTGAGGRPRSFGSDARVAVRSGATDADKERVLTECLKAAGLEEIVSGGGLVAIRASFMLGYDRNDRSNVNDPELVRMLAGYLRRHGAADVAVLEAPTVYGSCYENRSVAQVASYLGFDATEYRIVDISRDLRPYRYERGFVQQAISATWLDANVRIVMPKLRTDPTEFAHLSLSSLEGSTGPIDETVYAGRRTDFRSATMMLLDVAAPDFAVVDAWAPVADGPFGVMGCRRPADVRHIYAGADALAVDEVVLGDLGITDPRRAPIVRRAHHWFGLPLSHPVVDGSRPNLHDELRGAHRSVALRALGTLSYPVYLYLSNHGEVFVPEMDTVAFPPSGPTGPVTKAVRWSAQRAFGLRPPAQPLLRADRVPRREAEVDQIAVRPLLHASAGEIAGVPVAGSREQDGAGQFRSQRLGPGVRRHRVSRRADDEDGREA